MTLISIAFQDIHGNPIPPTVRADVYRLQDSPQSPVVTSAYLGVDSQITVPLTVGKAYRIQYVDRAAPDFPSFIVPVDDSLLTVVPDGYQSPWANTAGYAQIVAENFHLDRVAHSELRPGGGVYVLLRTMAKLMSTLDGFGRANAAGERFPTGNATQVDSYAQDFLGDTFPRLPGEINADFVARVEAWFQTPFGTLPAIALAVKSYFDSYSANESGYDVFDRQTDPGRSAKYGLTAGQVAIIVYHAYTTSSAWVLGRSTLGHNTTLSDRNAFSLSRIAPDPILGARIARVKAAGVVPVYITASGEPGNFT